MASMEMPCLQMGVFQMVITVACWHIMNFYARGLEMPCFRLQLPLGTDSFKLQIFIGDAFF